MNHSAPGSVKLDEKLRLADKLVKQGKAREAELVLRKLARRAGSSHILFCKLGAICWLQNRLDDAIDNFKMALAIKPEVPDAHWYLGSIYQQQGELGLAIECFQEALRFGPSNPARHFEYGNLQKAMGRTGQAISALSLIHI